MPQPVTGSTHEFRYRLAFVIEGSCVLRYDNGTGKGDHRHVGEKETHYHVTNKIIILVTYSYTPYSLYPACGPGAPTASVAATGREAGNTEVNVESAHSGKWCKNVSLRR